MKQIPELEELRPDRERRCHCHTRDTQRGVSLRRGNQLQFCA